MIPDACCTFGYGHQKISCIRNIYIAIHKRAEYNRDKDIILCPYGGKRGGSVMKSSTKSWISPRDIFAVAIIISGGFITILNQTVLSPALPSIMHDYGITASEGQWLTTAFMLVNGIMVPVTAYLIDRFTTRALFISSMLIFTAGTIVAGIAPSFEILLFARVLQAIGAGVQMPLGSVVMMLLFPKEKRGMAMGLVGIVVAFAPAIGPTISGWVVDNWGWHVIFLAIAPLSLAVIAFGFCFLRNIGEVTRPKLDMLSVIYSTLAFGGLLYGFSAAGSYGWLSPLTIVPLIVGSVVLVIYIRRQLTIEQPLLNLRVLQSSIFSYATILAMIVNAAIIAGTVIFPIYLQDVMHYSAMTSGLIMMPGAIVMGIMSPISGTLFDTFGPRTLSLVGLVIMTVTTGSFCFLSMDWSIFALCAVFCVRTFGMSMINMPINTWGINALDNSVVAHGNAVNNTARQVAGSIGTAIMVTVMTMTTAARTPSEGVVQGMLDGMNASFAFATVLALIALIIAFFKVHDDEAAIARREAARQRKEAAE